MLYLPGLGRHHELQQRDNEKYGFGRHHRCKADITSI